MSKAIPERKDIPQSHKWALEDLYEDISAWEQDLEKMKQLVHQLPDFKGKISKDPKALLDFMRHSEELSLICDDLANYAQRKSDEDTRVSENQALVSRVMALYTEAGELSDFEAPELLGISDETMEQFYAKEPELELYRRYFDKLRRGKEHYLDAAGEKLLK